MPRQTSVQLTESTQRQVAALTDLGFGNFTDIARIAIDRMYRQEIAMQAYTITKIDTTPEIDPYHAATSGETKTVLRISPAAREISLYQDYDDGASPSDEWHGIVVAAAVTGHPDAAEARQVLTDSDDVRAVIAGHSIIWDGSNHVGRLTDAAAAALERLVSALEDCQPNPVNVWQPDDYYDDVSDADLGLKPGMSDAELTALADKLEDDAHDDDVIIAGGAYSYLKTRLSYLDD